MHKNIVFALLSQGKRFCSGHTVKMPDAPFRLLVGLVMEQKKGDTLVWLTRHTEAGKYQSFERLRKPPEGSLQEKDAKKFIENDGSKRYSILTHPDFITFERDNLMRHPEDEVRVLTRRVP